MILNLEHNSSTFEFGSKAKVRGKEDFHYFPNKRVK